MAASESYIADHRASSAAPLITPRPGLLSFSYRNLLVAGEVTADLLTCIASLIAAFLVQWKITGHLAYPPERILAFGALQGLFAVLLLISANAYDSSNSLMRIRETERAMRAAIQAALLLLLACAILSLPVSRMAIFINLVLLPALLCVQKQMTHALTQALHTKSFHCERVVVYGAGEQGRRIASTLLHSPKLGLQPVAIWSDNSASSSRRLSVLGYRCNNAIPVRSEFMTASSLRALRSTLLIVAEPHLSAARLSEIKDSAKQAGIPLALVSDPAHSADTLQSVANIDGLMLTSPHQQPISSCYVLSKRLIDLLASTLLLIGLSPLLCIVALLVRLSSPGPSLFVQRRVGQHGELFNMYKFRTMLSGVSPYAHSPTHSNDLRLTSIGRVLRRLSLDELPQLINVLLGTMSLVGPRPEMPFIAADYNDQQRQRLQVMPGITGLWQLSADRAFPIHDNIEYDLYYIRHRTVFMDLAILLHTIFFAAGTGI